MKAKMFVLVTVVAVLFAVIPTAASAHVLDDVHGVVAQLGHQLLGLHHLPFTLLLVVIGVGLFRRWRKRAR